MTLNRTSIFIVDGNPMVRHTLAELIDHEKDLHVCGQAGNGKQALKKISSLKPDIAIVDLSLEDMDGMSLIRKLSLRRESPVDVLVVSMHEEGVFTKEAFQAGAKGYLMKTQAAANVLKAIRTIAKGGLYP